MASFDDLGRALRDDATANAPAASVIDLDAVTRAARARRRPRQWALGTLSVVAALGLGGLAITSITPPMMFAASESADSADLRIAEEGAEDGATSQSDESARSQPIVECGGAVGAPAASTEGWMLDARLPESSPATGGTIEGIASITNTGASVVSITTRPVVGGVLARDGVLVGSSVVIGDVGVATDLAPGESRELPLRVETTACADGKPLGDGEYLVLMALEIVDASGSADSIIVGTEIALRLE